MLAPLAGDPGALAGKRARQRLDLADLAAALAQADAAVERVAAVELNVVRDRTGLRLVDLYLQAVALPDFWNLGEGVLVQASGVEHEHADRQPQSRDDIGDHHVLGLQAARQSDRRVSLRDLAQRALECTHRARRRKSGCGRVTEAW